MATLRMDHVGVNVEDLDGAVAFFTELGMEEAGRTPVEGPWVDRVNGIDDVRVDIVTMRIPDGHGQLELTNFHNPAAIGWTSQPPNALGLRSVMFAVDPAGGLVALAEPLG